MKKKCSDCREVLGLDMFGKNKNKKFGVQSSCKKCLSKSRTEYNIKNKDKLVAYRAKYRAKNKEKIAESNGEYRAKNKDKLAKYKVKYSIENKEKLAENRAKNKEKLAEYKAKYNIENKEKLAEYKAKYFPEYRTKNKEKIVARAALMSQIKSGGLVRPENCSICGIKCKPDGHHHNYSRPLDVTWLCRSCHQQIHIGVTKLAETKRSELETALYGGA